MKLVSSFKHWVAVCLLLVSGASSASVWAPSDGDSNFFSFTQASFPFVSGDMFGIFEDTVVDLGASAPVLTFTGAAKVLFTVSGANYTVSSGASSGTLLGSNNFQLAWKTGSVWKFERDSTVTPLGNLLYFSNAQNPAPGNIHALLAVDIVRSQATSDTPAVPLPASIWMMTSALMGLLYVGRRKSAVAA